MEYDYQFTPLSLSQMDLSKSLIDTVPLFAITKVKSQSME